MNLKTNFLAFFLILISGIITSSQEVFKNKDLGALSLVNWRLRTGGFLNKTNLPFYDFFNFNTQPFPVLLNSYDGAFMIPAYYSLNTPDFYGEVHLKYTTPYLLLKLLPALSNTLMRENLSILSLSTTSKRTYTEIGYSLSELLLIGEIGIYAGFENMRYRNIGVKLVFKLN